MSPQFLIHFTPHCSSSISSNPSQSSPFLPSGESRAKPTRNPHGVFADESQSLFPRRRIPPNSFVSVSSSPPLLLFSSRFILNHRSHHPLNLAPCRPSPLFPVYPAQESFFPPPLPHLKPILPASLSASSKSVFPFFFPLILYLIPFFLSFPAFQLGCIGAWSIFAL